MAGAREGELWVRCGVAEKGGAEAAGQCLPYLIIGWIRKTVSPRGEYMDWVTGRRHNVPFPFASGGRSMARSMALVVAILACGVLVSGCASVATSIPAAEVGLEDLKTMATYDVIGPAEGEATGGYLLFFIPIGIERKSGTVGWGTRLADPIRSAAVYNAIESVPEADALIAPRYHATIRNYIIYVKKTVRVKGKAIRFSTVKWR